MTKPHEQALLAALSQNTPNGTELSPLISSFKFTTIKRKSLLLRPNQVWNKVYFIHQGMIRLFYSDEQGREFNKGFFTERQLLWPIAPYAREHASLFSIAALEDLELSWCSFNEFRYYLESRGVWEHFALPFVEAFAEDKFLREYEFLIHPASQRYANFLEQFPQLAKRIPDYHLASYLGITHVSLSRLKNSQK